MTERRPVGLIHCGLGRAKMWRPFLKAMGEQYRPIPIELPGHGLAPDWDEDREFADQAVEIALDALPAEPIPLVAHSFGAVVALRIALERPYRISSLALIEPVLFAAVKGRWSFDKAQEVQTTVDRKVAAAEFAVAARDFHAAWGDGRPWAELPMEQRSYMMDRIRLISAGRSFLFDDRSDLLRPGRLEGLEMPVTFLDGGESHPAIAEIIEAIGDRMPRAEWITVPGAGHMVPVTHPGLVADALRDRLTWDADPA